MIIENMKQLRTVIRELDIDLLGAEEDKLVAKMFEILCITGTEAFQNGYDKGKQDSPKLIEKGELQLPPISFD